MRYYKLNIGGASGQTFDSTKSSCPLNIAFEIQIFSKNSTEVVGKIDLFNVSLEYFLLAKSYINMPIELQAGFLHTGILGPSYLNYSPVLGDLLLSGRIANVMGDFSGIQSKMTIFYIPYNINIPRYLGKSQFPLYSTMIRPGQNVAQEVKRVIEKGNKQLQAKDASLGNMIINILASAAKLIFLGPETRLMGATIDAFIRAASSLALQGVSNNEESVNKKLNYFTDHKNNLNLFAGSEPDVLGEVTLVAKDFLTQPEVVKVAGNISCKLRLRADIHVGTKITIEGTTPSLAGDLTSIKTLSSLIDTVKLFHTGTYIVTSVNHMGEFYNTSADSWSTLIEAAPTEQIHKIGR